MTLAEDSYPLTPLQQGMLFHSLSAGLPGMYVQQMVCDLREPLDLSAFRKAWQVLVERHAVLRTAFAWKSENHPLQIVHPHIDLPWTIENWRGFSPSEQDARRQEFLQLDRENPLDLETPPLFRLSAFELAEDHLLLVWTSHHALLDGRSRSILFDELFKLYEAFRDGAACELPSPTPFRLFADWLETQDSKNAAPFWKRLLACDDERRSLEPPPERHAPGVKKSLRLSQSLSTSLRSLAKHHNLTLNTLFQGAWAILLSRYSGTRRVIFGATRAGRRSCPPQASEAVGLLINTLPIPVDVAPDAALLPWLKQLRDFWISLEPYEHTPLSEIRKYIDLPPATSLFDSVVSFENYHLNARFGGHRTFRLLGQTNYPLAVYGYDDQEILFEIEYDGRRFDPCAVTRMLAHLHSLLAGFAANLASPISKLPLLTTCEQQQILVEWNATQRDYPRADCVHHLFEAQARRAPDSIAIVDRDTRITYQELNTRADALARYLQSLEVGPGTSVAICLPPSLEMIVAMLAILKAGGAYVPLDSQYPSDRLSFMLRDTAATVLLTERSLLQHFADTPTVVCLDENENENRPPSLSENISSNAKADSLAYIMYTSGSTGQPKGVCIPHRAINRLVVNTDYVELGPTDVVAQISDSCFDASTFEIWGALLNGARLVLMDRDSVLAPHALAENIAHHRVTTLFITTALFNALARETPAVFQGLKNVLFGGEECDPNAVKAVMENGPPDRLLHVYGPTETTTFATCYPVPKDADFSTRIPIGRPIANTTLYILDEGLNPQPVGVKGEIYIGGDGVAMGYLNQPQLTAASFVSSPFPSESRLYKTGDHARYLPDGNIEFLGRRDHQVKIRGFRVEMGEVEARLSLHPGVWQNVVEVRNGTASGDKRLVAYFVPAHSSEPPTVEDLRGFLSQKLPPYMIPGRFVMLDRMPLTARGKIDRLALSDLVLPDPALANTATRRKQYAPPWNAVQDVIIPIWEELLGVHPIGVEDDFFELGGDSLLLLPAAARMQESLEWEVPLSAFFPHPTIQSVAQKLVDREESKETPLWELQHGDGARPLFFLHGDYYGLGLYCRKLSRAIGPRQQFYAIHPHGVASQAAPTTIEAMAAEHLEAIRRIQPKGPYLLAGFCNGAVEAYEIARLLQNEGESVDALIMIDPPSLERLRETGFPVTPPDQDSDPKHTGLLVQCSHAIENYHPRPYDGQVVVLEPEDKLARARIASKEWARVAPKLDSRVIPGGHLTILTSRVQTLADTLNECLQRRRP